MIGYLNGKITFKSPTYVYIECYGVGYHVNISLNTYSQVEHLDTVKMLTYTHTNDDGSSLYGFVEAEDREIFSHLISVSGIGPNTARMILSYMTTPEIKSAILSENVKALNQVKGVGPKTAKRLILDLKDKIVKMGGSESIDVVNVDTTIKEEALSALIALGFPKSSVEKQVNNILKQDPTITQVEDLIKKVLKESR